MGTTDLDRSCDKMRRRGSEERQPRRRYVRASHASHTSRLTKHAREVTIGVDVVLLTNNFVVANGVGHRQHGDRASVNQAANPRVAAVLVGFQQEFSLPARGQGVNAGNAGITSPSAPYISASWGQRLRRRAGCRCRTPPVGARLAASIRW